MKMRQEYQQRWDNLYGQRPVDDDHKLTPVAMNWLRTLSVIDSDLVRFGVDNLHLRSNSAWPPSPSEFLAHCYSAEFDVVGGEIFDYIRRDTSKEWQWQSILAFNVYKKLQYNPHNNENPAAIQKRAERIHKAIDRNTLIPIPPPMVELPFKEPTKVNREKQKFQALMWFAITRSGHDDQIDGENAPMAHIFKAENSKQWMAEWYQKGQPTITDFLRDKGVTI